MGWPFRKDAGNAPRRPGPATAVWDVPVRLFHWSLVALLVISWRTGEAHEMEWHRLSGYCILALLIFRLYWGLAGSDTARFRTFVRGPRAVMAYLGALKRGSYRPAAGHNPIGGWSVVVMLAALTAMVGAGLFSVDVDGLESGPLADYVSFDQGRTAAHAHAFLFNALLLVVALHVAAILFYLIRFRQNLVGPMIHGGRSASADGRGTTGAGAPWKAIAGILVAAGCAYFIARGLKI